MLHERKDLSQILVLIPALDPDEKMIRYVRNLEQEGFSHILLVDDGSGKEHQKYFEELAEDEQVQVLHHDKNHGKGRALKNGFLWCMKNFAECAGVVTADCDGQHGAEDTRKVAEALSTYPREWILGSRDFSREQVPWKSRCGNRITTAVFALLYGRWISDTQTGLRGIGRSYLRELGGLAGDRYEYEIQMLIYGARHGVTFRNVTIETIYINDNESSHFHPFRDSVKIYRVILGTFFRYLLSSLSASLIDIGLFTVFNGWLFSGMELKWNILCATVSARIISSLYNFSVNRKLVFAASGNVMRMMFGYYTLVVIQMGCSAGLVYLLTRCLGGWSVPSKIIVDSLLFLVSYQIQQRWIFGRDSGEVKK